MTERTRRTLACRPRPSRHARAAGQAVRPPPGALHRPHRGTVWSPSVRTPTCAAAGAAGGAGAGLRILPRTGRRVLMMMIRTRGTHARGGTRMHRHPGPRTVAPRRPPRTSTRRAPGRGPGIRVVPPQGPCSDGRVPVADSEELRRGPSRFWSPTLWQCMAKYDRYLRRSRYLISHCSAGGVAARARPADKPQPAGRPSPSRPAGRGLGRPISMPQVAGQCRAGDGWGYPSPSYSAGAAGDRPGAYMLC